MRRQRLEADRAQRRREPLALLDHRRHVGRRGERGDRERGREARDGRRRLARVQLGRELARGERVPDPRAGERERLRERAQHDHVAVVDERDRGLAEVLEVRLVDDERPRVRQRPQLAGRAARPAREGEHRVVVADLGARELRRDPVERVGRRGRDRDRVARPGERARAEQDQVVGADAEHDLVGIDAGVVGDRAAQRRRSRRAGSR